MSNKSPALTVEKKKLDKDLEMATKPVENDKELAAFLEKFSTDPVEAIRGMSYALAKRIPEEKKTPLWSMIKKNKQMTEDVFHLILSNLKSDFLPNAMFENETRAQNLFDTVYDHYSRYLQNFLINQGGRLIPILKKEYNRKKIMRFNRPLFGVLKSYHEF